MPDNTSDVSPDSKLNYRHKGGGEPKTMTTAELLAANGIDVHKLVVETFDPAPQQGWFDRFLRQSRPVTLGPGLRSAPEVREDLLASIARRAELDVSDDDRQGTAKWIERVKGMPDELLWSEYAAAW
ncbi:HAD family hydrolase, partial [Mycobacteroides abscessus]|uniref:hypothetical protein n=1 Tax=Mycobacteroides abscessus TaxID=36809 RepID=UPI001055DB4C